ncbi:MAG: hypothetical protein ACRDPY_22440 [Streptosporangiaceae bacterium]
MTVAALRAATPRRRARDSLVEVTIPVFNEEKVLAESVRRLHCYLSAQFLQTGGIPVMAMGGVHRDRCGADRGPA